MAVTVRNTIGEIGAGEGGARTSSAKGVAPRMGPTHFPPTYGVTKAPKVLPESGVDIDSAVHLAVNTPVFGFTLAVSNFNSPLSPLYTHDMGGVTGAGTGAGCGT